MLIFYLPFNHPNDNFKNETEIRPKNLFKNQRKRSFFVEFRWVFKSKNVLLFFWKRGKSGCSRKIKRVSVMIAQRAIRWVTEGNAVRSASAMRLASPSERHLRLRVAGGDPWPAMGSPPATWTGCPLPPVNHLPSLRSGDWFTGCYSKDTLRVREQPLSPLSFKKKCRRSLWSAYGRKIKQLIYKL